jgi:DnaJ-domain-containing protein 1
MSKKFELPPMVGVDPSRSPRAGRLRTLAEIEALERGRPPPTTHGFSKQPGAVAAGISGRAEREVDPKHMEMLQRPAHTERGRSPLRASGLISSTLARSFQNYLDYYSKSKEKDEALRHKIDDYLRAMEEEQRYQQQRHREHGPGPAPERPKSPKSPKSPRSKYPAPTSKRAAFELLGIAPSSTEAEINKAYRKMALKLHPDKNLHNLIEAEEQFKQLQAAVDMIKKSGQMGGRNRSNRVHRRRNTRHTKRSNKSSKSSKRHSKTHRR